MGRRQSSEVNLQKILTEAHRTGAADASPAVDAQALMRRIRSLPAPDEATSPMEFLDRLFWRLAPAAGALIAVLAMVMLNLDFIPDTEVWSMWSYESEASDMVQTLLLQVSL